MTRPVTKEMIRASLEGCKRTFDVRLKGLTPEGIALLTEVMPGELNAQVVTKDRLKLAAESLAHQLDYRITLSREDWQKITEVAAEIFSILDSPSLNENFRHAEERPENE